MAANILLPRRSRFSLPVNRNTTEDNGSWGLPPGMKLEDTLRVGFQNFSGLPQFTSHPKNDLLCSFILAHDFDIFGIAETNLKWCALPAESQFYE